MDENSGVYHLANKGEVSRYDFAQKILSLISSYIKVKTTTIIPVKSSDFSSPALRPGYSALDCSKFEKTFEVILPTWDLSLSNALQQFKN